MTPGYRQAVWSWTEHLRRGGATPWTAWVDSAAGAPGAGSPPDGWVVPGAATLELVRRAAAEPTTRLADFPSFADLVLDRSGPGRGLGQQPLAWPRESRHVGTPAVDPADVPVAELVRTGVGVLAELLVRSGGAPEQDAVVRRGLLTRTPAFVLAGPPVTTAAVRRRLGAAGHLEGGRSPRVLVLVDPLDHALAQAWSARVQQGAAVRWAGFVTRWSGRRRLPAGADPVAAAHRWADRVGHANVHLVAAADPARAVADLLGLGGSGATRAVPPPRWADLSPEAVDVVRRVNAVLGVRVDPDRHASLVRLLVSHLAQPGAPGHGLGVPPRHRAWAQERARGLAADLRAGRYAVHGDLDRVVPRFGGLATRPRIGSVLAVVVRAALDQAAANEHLQRAKEPGR